jgi:hypothetical protein
VEEGLKIRLGADVTELQRGLAQAAQSFSGFEDKVKGFEGTVGGFMKRIQDKLNVKKIQLFNEQDPANIAKINRQIESLENLLERTKRAGKEGFDSFGEPIKRLSPNLRSASTAMGGFSKSTGQADQTLLNFSRVLQDAPYGIMGVANNLNPLSEAFGRLRQSTGSTGAALKAMVGSIMGSGGIGLAIGAASSLLVLFGDKLFKTKNTAKEASKELKETAKSVQEIAASFAADNIAKIETFRIALTNLSIPLEERNKVLGSYNKLVDKQNELSKTDLSNIEKINAAVNAQVKLFERRALVRAAEEKIVELYKEVFKAQFEITKAATGLDNSNKKLTQSVKASNGQWEQTINTWARAGQQAQKTQKETSNWKIVSPDQIADLRDLNTGLTMAELTLAKANEKEFRIFTDQSGVQRIVGKTTDLYSRIVDVKGQIQELFDFINRQVSQGGINVLDNFDVDKIEKTVEALKSFPKAVRVQVIPEIEKPKIDPIILPAPEMDSGLIPRLEADGRAASEAFRKSWEATFAAEGLPLPSIEFAGMYSEILNAGKQIQAIVASFGGEIATAISEAIGGALTGNFDFGSIFKGLFTALGTALQEAGKTLVMASTAMQAFKKALNFLVANPAAALPVGLGLMITGSIIKNITGKMPRFAEGGIVSGPTFGLMGEYPGASSNPEVIAPLNKLKDLIKGSSGNNFPAYLPAHAIKGDTLMLWYQRANKSQTRRV